MGYPHYDLVQRAHSDLKAEGLIKARATQDEVEQDKGLLTRRAAWYVNQQRDPAHGLLAKTSGNNSQGYSVDWILSSRDGDGWDIATDDGVNALPLNGDAHGPDPARIADWRSPTAELAQMPIGGSGGGETTPPEPTPTPPPDYSEILHAISASEAAIMAHDDANTQRVLDMIDSIKTQVEDSLRKALGLVVIKRKRDADEQPTT